MAENSNDEEARKFWLAFERRWLQQAEDLKPKSTIVAIRPPQFGS
jgi:hypothetical protein